MFFNKVDFHTLNLALLLTHNATTRDCIASTQGAPKTPLVAPSDVFKSLSNCLLLEKGWWSYEFCYNKHLKQFHRLDQTEAAHFASLSKTEQLEKFNENNILLGKSYGDKLSSLNSYFHHSFKSGTWCDLINKERQATIQYHCFPGVEDRIASITETSTCNYLVVIHTSRTCDYTVDNASVTKIICIGFGDEKEIPKSVASIIKGWFYFNIRQLQTHERELKTLEPPSKPPKKNKDEFSKLFMDKIKYAAKKILNDNENVENFIILDDLKDFDFSKFDETQKEKPTKKAQKEVEEEDDDT